MYLSKFILRLNSHTFTSSVADTATLSNTQFRSSLPEDKERERESKSPSLKSQSPRESQITKSPENSKNKPIYIGKEGREVGLSAVSASCRDQSQRG